MIGTKASVPLLALLLLFPAPAAAEMEARKTAAVGQKGSWSVGVFAPLQIAFSDGAEVRLHPLTAAVAPHASLRLRHGELGPFRLAGEYSLLLPTPAMRLVQGTFFPAWDLSGRKMPWQLVPGAAVVASAGEVQVTTVRISLWASIPLEQSETLPFASYAPLDLLLSPMLRGYRLRAGVSHDRPLGSRLRLRGGADLWLTGSGGEPARSPLFLSAGAGVDLRLARKLRLCAGQTWFNSDQGRTSVEVAEDGFSVRRPRRTNDLFPVIDLIWEGGPARKAAGYGEGSGRPASD
ncbi:MAG: hypothetical protein ACOCVR_04600 [Myxococcota bacterium]